MTPILCIGGDLKLVKAQLVVPGSQLRHLPLAPAGTIKPELARNILKIVDWCRTSSRPLGEEPPTLMHTHALTRKLLPHGG